MDQAAAHVHYEESKNPKDKEYYRDGPKHDVILARSELHLARLKMYPVDAAPAFPLALRGHMQDGNEHA
jgi:hypothetical protein